MDGNSEKQPLKTGCVGYQGFHRPKIPMVPGFSPPQNTYPGLVPVKERYGGCGLATLKSSLPVTWKSDVCCALGCSRIGGVISPSQNLYSTSYGHLYKKGSILHHSSYYYWCFRISRSSLKTSTGWCSTPTLLLICSSFSRESGRLFLICPSLSTPQVYTHRIHVPWIKAQLWLEKKSMKCKDAGPDFCISSTWMSRWKLVNG